MGLEFRRGLGFRLWGLVKHPLSRRTPKGDLFSRFTIGITEAILWLIEALNYLQSPCAGPQVCKLSCVLGSEFKGFRSRFSSSGFRAEGSSVRLRN